MNIRPTLAIVDNKFFYTLAGKLPHQPIASLTALLWEISKTEFTHVWIVAGCQMSRDSQRPGWLACSQWDTKANDENKPAFIRGWKLDGTGETFYVGIPEFYDYPWQGCESVKTLLATIVYIENVIGLNLEWGVGHMSLEFYKKKNINRYSWLTPCRFDFQAQGIDIDRSRRPIKYKSTRKIGVGEKLYKYDENSNFMAGVTGLLLGEGTPKVVGPEDFDDTKPAFWRVKVTKQEGCIFDGKLSLEDYELMTTDMILCGEKLGYSIVATEGVQWEKYHRTLESTATHLWKARNEYRGKRELSMAHLNCYETISGIMHRLPGKLGSDKTDAHLRRRDMWGMIESQAICNIMYKIKTIYDLTGMLPDLVDVDALVYPQPIEHTGLVDICKLGGFKREYEVEVTTEIVGYFETLKPGQVMTRLNEIGRK